MGKSNIETAILECSRDCEDNLQFSLAYKYSSVRIIPNIRNGRMELCVSTMALCTAFQSQMQRAWSIYNECVSAYFHLIHSEELGDNELNHRVLMEVLELPLNEVEKQKVQDKLKDFSFVYLIKDHSTELVKIGKSDNPTFRLEQLKKQPTLLPYPHNFELIHAWRSRPQYEMELHECFKEYRERGEWFRLTEDNIKDIVSSFSMEIDIITGRYYSEVDHFDYHFAKSLLESGDSNILEQEFFEDLNE